MKKFQYANILKLKSRIYSFADFETDLNKSEEEEMPTNGKIYIFTDLNIFIAHILNIRPWMFDKFGGSKDLLEN